MKFVFYFLYVATSLAFEYNNERTIEKVHESILNLVNNSDTLIFLLNNENNIYIPSNIKQSFTYFYYKQNYTQFYRNSTYIVITENSSTLLQLLEERMNFVLLSRSFYEETFVVVTLNNKNKEETFKILWELSIIKVILIHIENNEPTCSTSYPFDEKNRCGKYVNFKHLTYCNETVHFPKYPTNLKGCELNVGLISKVFSSAYIGNEHSDKPGIFLMPFKLLIQKYGLKVSFKRFNFEERVVNYKWNAPFYIMDLVRKKVDVAVATVDSKAHTLNTNHYIEFSDIFYDDIIVWMIPKPKRMSNVKIVWGIFSKNVWIILTFIFSIGNYFIYI